MAGTSEVTLPAHPRGQGAELGVVIPALDEAAALPGLLSDLSWPGLDSLVLVVDGGSGDETVPIARAGGAEVLRSRRGRARQMNAGATFIAAPWLLFLHADSRLDDRALTAIARHVRRDERQAGYFRLSFRHPGRFYRAVERGQRLRARRLGLIYGDQGLLVPRDLFFALGPYPDEPLMEDVILNRRLLRAGRLHPIPATVTTSARRYEEEGRIRAWLRNVRLISRLLAGAAPDSLAAAYPPRGPAPGESLARSQGGPLATLLVFAKAPRPGAVKTRLARTIGDDAAAAVYRRLGRLVVGQVADAPATVTVCHAPDDAGQEIRDWLGPASVRYWPQGGGDLGARMSRMFDRAFAGSQRAIVIGTDCPAVTGGTIRRALGALDSANVVLGPSRDGGYYLMALRRPQPDLFTRIPWSTGTVMEETVARCRALGLEVTCLEVESDIDTAADLTPEMAGHLGRAV